MPRDRAGADNAPAVSPGNVELLRPILAEWEGGNFAAGTNMRGPEVELSTFIRGGKVLCHGTDEIDRYLGEFFAQWRDYHITVERLQPLDEATVVLEGHQHGVGKGSGAKTTDALTIVFKLDRERITVMHWHRQREEALNAAGLLT